jgi:hypothetical protein
VRLEVGFQAERLPHQDHVGPALTQQENQMVDPFLLVEENLYKRFVGVRNQVTFGWFGEISREKNECQDKPPRLS